MRTHQAEMLVFLGLLFVSGSVVARTAARFGLPSMTGHLVAGLALGMPFAPTIRSSHDSLAALELAAGAVVVFWVGAKLSLERLRLDLRSAATLGAATLLSVLACAIVLALALEEPSWAVIVAALCLSTASPTIVALVSREVDDEGRAGQTVLHATVLANVAIAALVVVVLGSAALWGSAEARHASLPRDLGVGATTGIGLGLVISWRRWRREWVARASCAAIAFVMLHGALDRPGAPILAGALVAGVIAANRAGGARTESSVARAVPIASAVLFLVAGAVADLRMVLVMAEPAVALVLVRAASLWVGARVSGAIARDGALDRFGCTPLLPQAGFTLALVGMFDGLDGPSELVLPLLVSVVLINEVAMPPLLRLAYRTGAPPATSC